MNVNSFRTTASDKRSGMKKEMKMKAKYFGHVYQVPFTILEDAQLAAFCGVLGMGTFVD